jgi:hypothetical protein
MSAPESGIYSYEMAAQPLFGRQKQRRQQMYQQVAQPAVPWVAQPQMPTQTQSREQHTGSLSAGETVWRTPDTYTDVAVPFNFSLIAAGLFAGVLVSIVGCIKWPSILWGIPGLSFVAAETLYLIAGWDILKKDEKNLRVRERLPEIVQESPLQGKYKVAGQIKEGQKTIYTEFDIDDPQSWHLFCQAVHYDGKNFSLRTAKSKNIGVKPEDFNSIVRKWASPDPQLALIDPATVGERLVIKLTRMGRKMVRLYAEQPPTLDG